MFEEMFQPNASFAILLDYENLKVKTKRTSKPLTEFFFVFLVSFETFHKNILSGTQSHFFHKSSVLISIFHTEEEILCNRFFLTFGVFCYVQTPKIFLAYFLYYEKYEIGRLIHSLCNFLLQPKIYYARQEYVIEF